MEPVLRGALVATRSSELSDMSAKGNAAQTVIHTATESPSTRYRPATEPPGGRGGRLQLHLIDSPGQHSETAFMNPFQPSYFEDMKTGPQQ